MWKWLTGNYEPEPVRYYTLPQSEHYQVPDLDPDRPFTVEDHIWWAEWYLMKATEMTVSPGIGDPLQLQAMQTLATLHNHIGGTKLAKLRYDREVAARVGTELNR